MWSQNSVSDQLQTKGPNGKKRNACDIERTFAFESWRLVQEQAFLGNQTNAALVHYTELAFFLFRMVCFSTKCNVKVASYILEPGSYPGSLDRRPWSYYNSRHQLLSRKRSPMGTFQTSRRLLFRTPLRHTSHVKTCVPATSYLLPRSKKAIS